MNKKITILVCLMALFGLKLAAQNEYHYGFFLGGSINTMNISESLYYDDTEPFTTLDPTPQASYMTVHDAKVKFNGGFMLGGFFEYDINKLMTVHLGLFYNQTGYKLTGYVEQKNIGNDEYVQYGYKSNLKMSNINMALMMRFNVIKKYLSVDLGIQPGYCFRMVKEAERGLVHKTTVYESSTEYNPFNFCIAGGLTYYIFSNFYFSARYSLGLTDMLKVKTPYVITDDEGNVSSIHYRYSNTKSTTSSIMLSIGFRLN